MQLLRGSWKITQKSGRGAARACRCLCSSLFSSSCCPKWRECGQDDGSLMRCSVGLDRSGRSPCLCLLKPILFFFLLFNFFFRRRWSDGYSAGLVSACPFGLLVKGGSWKGSNDGEYSRENKGTSSSSSTSFDSNILLSIYSWLVFPTRGKENIRYDHARRKILEQGVSNSRPLAL